MNLKIERFRKYSKLVGLVIKAASILLWLSVLSGMIGLLYCAVSSEEDFGVFPAGEGTVYYGLKNSSTRYGPLPAPLPDEFSVRGETLSAIVVSTSINGLAAYSIHCLVKIFQDAAGEDIPIFHPDRQAAETDGHFHRSYCTSVQHHKQLCPVDDVRRPLPVGNHPWRFAPWLFLSVAAVDGPGPLWGGADL